MQILHAELELPDLQVYSYKLYLWKILSFF